ncbi:hypothetical protein R5W24_004115 [Gemmata sp. JC717]|uniref:hypothetical protein n=1 Tax=Gemmata algarum TaxID=2975278 RepID=UPI0021BB1FCC|nr:hypothetical protein [Gemmata algarum]MDY3554983.1 hypothetical protein [Gemmata algarum]
MTASLATFGDVPQAVAEYLLARNTQLAIGAWGASTLDQGTVLVLAHKAALRSLSAEGFGEICEAMVREAQCLDAQLQSAGVLSRFEARRG